MKSPTIKIVTFSHENCLTDLTLLKSKNLYSKNFWGKMPIFFWVLGQSSTIVKPLMLFCLFSWQMRYSRYQCRAISLKKLTSLTYTKKESKRAAPKWHFKELRVRTALCCWRKSHKICQEHVRVIFSSEIKRNKFIFYQQKNSNTNNNSMKNVFNTITFLPL